MTTINIKYGDTQYEISIKYLPYLATNEITLTDDQIKKDIHEAFYDRKMELTLLHIAVILNYDNWVRRLIALDHPIIIFTKTNMLSPLAIAFENKNNNISFDIAKLIIEKTNSALYYNYREHFKHYASNNIEPFNIFYSKKQNAENWVYITRKCFDTIINRNYHSMAIDSYSDIDNIKEEDAAYKLIYDIMENYIIVENYIKGEFKVENYFIHDALKKICEKIMNKKISYSGNKSHAEFIDTNSKISEFKTNIPVESNNLDSVISEFNSKISGLHSNILDDLKTRLQQIKDGCMSIKTNLEMKIQELENNNEVLKKENEILKSRNNLYITMLANNLKQ